MMKTRTVTVVAALLCCSSATLAHAKGPRYTDPAHADSDFAVQGEYSGLIDAGGDELKIGVQVIAFGDGNFRAVGFPDGLPGDGWNGKDRHENEATKTAEGVSFENDHARGLIKDGTLTIMSLDGEVMGKLERVNRESPTLGKKPPEGAVVLFDGSNVDHWKNGRKTPDGLLLQGTTSIPTFQSHQLHIEFRLPYQPNDLGQARGNSGLYLQGRYEVQMLDSFGLLGEHNECGGVYGIKAPDLNMCFPPLSWQTFDVDFKAAKYDDDGNVTENPRMTVRHNGVVVHKDVELPKATTAAPQKPGPEAGPVHLQNHGNPVRYRNIWVLPIDDE